MIYITYDIVIYYSLTRSPGENTVTGLVQGQSLDGSPCHIWTQLFDCIDGSFILRYKVFNTCLNIKIKVKIKGKELPISNTELKGICIYVSCKILNLKVP